MKQRVWAVVLGMGLIAAVTACAAGAAATTASAAGTSAGAVAQVSATATASATRRVTPSPSVSCVVLASQLLVRSGPGTVFPVEGRLQRNTVLQAVALVPVGAPGGRWVGVERLIPGKALSFVSAESQLLLCRSSLAALPIARVPATPQATPTRTPRPSPTRLQPLALVPVAGDLSASPNLHGHDPRNEGALVLVPGLTQAEADEAIEQDGIIRFDDALVFGVDVFDDTVGPRTGDGIKEVQFDVYYFNDDGDKVQVHFQRELRVPYCVFGDPGTTCNVWRFSEHDNRWPNGEPLTPDTVFRADITITATSGDEALWLWQFRMD